MGSGDEWQRDSATSSRHWRSRTITGWFADHFREATRTLGDGPEWREPGTPTPLSEGPPDRRACWAFELVGSGLVPRRSLGYLPSKNGRSWSPGSRGSPPPGWAHDDHSD